MKVANVVLNWRDRRSQALHFVPIKQYQKSQIRKKNISSFNAKMKKPKKSGSQPSLMKFQGLLTFIHFKHFHIMCFLELKSESIKMRDSQKLNIV